MKSSFILFFSKMMSSAMADMPFWNILARQLKIGLVNLWRTVCNAKISPTLRFFFLLAFAALLKKLIMHGYGDDNVKKTEDFPFTYLPV
jgi:hypothetical protein